MKFVSLFKLHRNAFMLINLLYIGTIANWNGFSCVLTENSVGTGNSSSSPHEEREQVALARWKYEEFQAYITVLVFLCIVILLKMIYHRLHWFAAFVPESLVLIVVGVVFGVIIRFTKVAQQGDARATLTLTPRLFFNILLPPIVLEAAYTLYNRTFGDYLGTILVYAVLGTIFNFLIIGLGLWGISAAGWLGAISQQMDLTSYLLFSSFIVAVDPVAVLAIFQDIGVDAVIYYMVFGESLLNDAVTVVLYDIMKAFAGRTSVTAAEIVIGIFSFFTVSLGGLLIGIVFGVLTCLITRFHNSMEVIIVALLGFFSYVLADMVGWSGIIAITGCGLVEAAYAFHNMQATNVVAVRRVIGSIAELSEAVIFLFLGIELFSDGLIWDTGFHLWSLLLCLLVRFFVVFLLTAIINWANIDGCKIKFREQLLLSYGGLRGAVAFSLAVLVDESSLSHTTGLHQKRVMVTATLFIILFTICIMGLTTKPMVRLLKIKLREKKELSLFIELYRHVNDSLMESVEIISGERGRNRLRNFFIRIDDEYIRRILQRDPYTHDQKILKMYEKVALKLHYATIQPSLSLHHLDDLPVAVKEKQIKHSTGLLPSPSSVCLSQLANDIALHRRAAFSIDPPVGEKNHVSVFNSILALEPSSCLALNNDNALGFSDENSVTFQVGPNPISPNLGRSYFALSNYVDTSPPDSASELLNQAASIKRRTSHLSGMRNRQPVDFQQSLMDVIMSKSMLIHKRRSSSDVKQVENTQPMKHSDTLTTNLSIPDANSYIKDFSSMPDVQASINSEEKDVICVNQAFLTDDLTYYPEKPDQTIEKLTDEDQDYDHVRNENKRQSGQQAKPIYDRKEDTSIMNKSYDTAKIRSKYHRSRGDEIINVSDHNQIKRITREKRKHTDRAKNKTNVDVNYKIYQQNEKKTIAMPGVSSIPRNSTCDNLEENVVIAQSVTNNDRLNEMIFFSPDNVDNSQANNRKPLENYEKYKNAMRNISSNGNDSLNSKLGSNNGIPPLDIEVAKTHSGECPNAAMYMHRFEHSKNEYAKFGNTSSDVDTGMDNESIQGKIT